MTFPVSIYWIDITYARTYQQGHKAFNDKNSKPIELGILNWVVNKKKIKTKVRSAISEPNAIMQAFHKLERGYIKSQIDETGQHSFHWIVIKAKKEKEKQKLRTSKNKKADNKNS